MPEVESKHPTPEWREDEISQIPALQLLVNLGWTYLTPAEALDRRGGRRSRVILTEILAGQLRSMNRVRTRGEELPFSESNIAAAVQALEDLPFDGLIRTSEQAYDLLRLGKSFPQLVRGNLASYDLDYVDWENTGRNVFHVTEEFVVDSQGAADSRRPDLVLFVNGIPFVVIECKRPDIKDPLKEAISQQIRNQKDGYIPRLFVPAQLLLALATNQARYATVGTSEKFWAVWREELDAEVLQAVVNQPLDPLVKERLFADRFRHVRAHFDVVGAVGRQVTEQDRLLYALCRPERLLQLARRFILFDAGEKKIARWQQFFCLNKTMLRIAECGPDGTRQGGVVWHTQGSGKSLTMVMLATAIAEEIQTSNQKKVVLVTDRVDLDDQIYNTFRHCGLTPERARTGQHLAKLLQQDGVPVVTTVIDKFEAVTRLKVRLDSPDIFVLVDESHRGQYGPLHARMRKVMPNACFLGFTGTPLLREDKNTIATFGGLIDSYTIRQAVADRAVVELVYEGRDVPQHVDKEQIDRWFERTVAGLSPAQAADLKRKFSSTNQLNEAEQRIAAIAYDVGLHFAATWKGTGFKGQLVAPSKRTALLYKKYLDELGDVTSSVLISAPDDREGDADVHEDNEDEVVKFWRATMSRYGTETEYNKQFINSFKFGDTPDILIVVSKLLTGFDAPRNTVLYLARTLKEHTLLQAIARVNRVYEGKDFGYVIDYAGVLHGLNEALDLYGSLAGYDPADLDDTLVDISEKLRQLPQAHSNLWEIFKGIRNKRDQEAYEQLLADEELRSRFYERLTDFARLLGPALGSVRFLDTTPAEKVETYKRDLKFFAALRRSVGRRYADTVDYGEYEKRVRKLLDRHVSAGEVETITPAVNIFDQDAFAKVVDEGHSPAAKADTIAYATKKTIHDRMDEDPAFYKRFSALLEETIEAWRAKRLSDAEYLAHVAGIRDSVRDRTGDEVPERVRYQPDARAIYGLVKETLAPYSAPGRPLDAVGAEAALDIDRIIEDRRVVNWTENSDVQNRMRTAIEDRLFDLKQQEGLPLTLDEIDAVMERVLDVARRRKA